MERETRIRCAIRDLQTQIYPSLRTAADAYQVSYTTLYRRMNGQQNRVAAASHQQSLSTEQEQTLSRWILEAERAGHAFTHAQMKEMASIVYRASGGSGHIGKNWIARFLARNPAIHTKKGRAIPSNRVNGLTPAKFCEWFSTLEALLSEYSIKACNYWNMDEVGCTLGVCTNQNIIGSSQTNSSIVVGSQNREWVIIIECISGGGQYLKPLTIFMGKRVQQQWFNREDIPDWLYTSSPTAWTSSDIAYEWLTRIFIDSTKEGLNESDYRLLLLDGHTTHISVDFMWKCHQNHIILYYLIPHASHILQPLDLAVFSPLKRKYRELVNKFSQTHDSIVVQKLHFIRYYQAARLASFTSGNIKSGWNAAGILPWNPRKVLKSKFIIQGDSEVDSHRPLTPEPSQLILDEVQTPTNRMMLYNSVMKLSQEEKLGRSTRTLFRKTIKVLNSMNMQQARIEQELAVAKKTIDDLCNKKKKRKAVHPNEMFHDIAAIKLALDTTEPATTRSRKRRKKAATAVVEDSDSEANDDPFLAVVNQLRSIRSYN